MFANDFQQLIWHLKFTQGHMSSRGSLVLLLFFLLSFFLLIAVILVANKVS